jgi:hypothetical protein
MGWKRNPVSLTECKSINSPSLPNCNPSPWKANIQLSPNSKPPFFTKPVQSLGAAVYRWEGILNKDSHTGETGILIGDTDDIRQRINQYIHGQQASGNTYWRSIFLEKGDIHLFILNLHLMNFQIDNLDSIAFNIQDFSSGNMRLVYEQTLVMREAELKRPHVWIANRKL